MATPVTNIPAFIRDRLARRMHTEENHPIKLVKDMAYQYFTSLPAYNFQAFDDLAAEVSVADNFDKLLIPANHPARSTSDTYYVDSQTVLRTHTSAHQNQLLARGITSFLVSGPVYRKDEINATHYPIFHQLEMLTLIDNDVDAVTELKTIIAGLLDVLFPGCEYRFADDYFPFTHPSYEVEVKYEGKWVEILGCGVVQPQILANNGYTNRQAIAVGFGLDRLAMIFACIPDIRYLWSTHPRFLNQFTADAFTRADRVRFEPYSTLDSQTRDVSFFIEPAHIDSEGKWTMENDFFELARNNPQMADNLEQVVCFDTYYNPKKQLHSKAYHMVYQPSDPTLSNPAEFSDIVNQLQAAFVALLPTQLPVTLK